MGYRFSPTFFQRGQTWQECLASWQHDRRYFLTLVSESRPLPQLAVALARAPRAGRVAVYYDPLVSDVRKLLPALGLTLQAAEHLQVRFFDARIYFPELYPVFGRAKPTLAFLKDDGSLAETWGPRPAAVTEQLPAQDEDPLGRAAWLMTYDQDCYRQLAETELLQCVGRWISR